MKLLKYNKGSLALLCGAFLLFAGCGGGTDENTQKPQTQGQKPQAPTLKANTLKLSKGNQKLHFEYPARVRSVGSVDVYAKVSGTLLEQLYKEGEFVEKDTPLFRIDPDVYKATYNEALATLEVRKATLMQAERDWERSSKLFEQKALSQKEKDDAFSTFESAKANVASAEASLQRAELNLSYTTIVAPASGMSGVKLQDVGAYVGTTGSTIVTTITQTAPIYVEFSVADSQAISAIVGMRSGKIKTSGDLGVKVLDRQGNLLDEGQIDFIDSRIDESIGSVKIRAIVPNEKNALLPGQFVRASIEGVEIPNAAIIPQQALLQTAQGTFVYLLKDGKAKIIPVKIEQTLTKEFIVTGLFEDGDELILNNLLKIRPDAPVQADNGGK